MDKDRDLLPWILGGLSMAAVALAVALGNSPKIASSPASLPSPMSTQALPAVLLAAAPVATSAVATAALVAPAPVAAPAPAATPLLDVATPIRPLNPPIQNGAQIWQCTINGQKVFSNNPCGDRSSLLDVGPINTMDRAPMYQIARPYQPPPGYAPEYVPDYAPDYASSGPQEQGDNSYPAWVGIPFGQRRMPLRTHRPYTHGHGTVARKY
jgi:hypothetical protein